MIWWFVWEVYWALLSRTKLFRNLWKTKLHPCDGRTCGGKTLSPLFKLLQHLQRAQLHHVVWKLWGKMYYTGPPQRHQIAWKSTKGKTAPRGMKITCVTQKARKSDDWQFVQFPWSRLLTFGIINRMLCSQLKSGANYNQTTITLMH